MDPTDPDSDPDPQTAFASTVLYDSLWQQRRNRFSFLSIFSLDENMRHVYAAASLMPNGNRTLQWFFVPLPHPPTPPPPPTPHPPPPGQSDRNYKILGRDSPLRARLLTNL
jgi:hypothetical protein